MVRSGQCSTVISLDNSEDAYSTAPKVSLAWRRATLLTSSNLQQKRAVKN